MAKQNKTICLNSEVIEKLEKEKSASNLINELLSDYFSKNGNLRKEELKKRIINLKADKSRIEQEMEIINRNIEKIESNEKRTKEIFKDIPNEIIKDFKAFPNMTEEILKTRFNNIYSKIYKINWEEIEKAFKEFKGDDGKDI